MTTSKQPIFINLLCLFLLSQQTFGNSNTITNSAFLYHTCSTNNYTANSPFASNLKQSFHQLSSTAPPFGFAITSVGNNTQNQANRLTLCRGDVSPADCKNCIDTANEEIRKRCPSSKGGSIWYDFCLLKYSNTKFFGKIENGVRVYMWNVEKAKNPARFNEQVKKLLSKLVEKVETSPKLFVIGEDQETEGSKKLYGLVQCTRDLAGEACKKCLRDAIAELPNCCDAKIGGRVMGGSCNFRYEIYPFLEAQK